MSRKEKIISALFLESFCHATENCEKVKKAMLNLLPSDVWEKVKISEVPLEGHYKNPIVIIKFEIRDKTSAQEAVEYIFSELDEIDKKIIIDSLDLRTDSSNLYLRFDKQQAYLGKTRLLQGDDVIKAKISFMPHIRRRHSIEHALEILGLKLE
ncbi:MAG: exosome protein [Thermoprotei archaeon]|nr:MAG: exosome protein [Thermoprotei archaeon]